MKRIFTSVLMLCITAIMFAGVNTATKVSVVNTYSYLSTETKPATPNAVQTKLYNKDNQLEVEINSTNKYMYSYNTEGKVSMKKAYSWNSTNKIWNLSSKTTYEYDALGQVIRENSFSTTADTITSYREYSGYTNGVYNSAKTMNYNGTKFTYWNTYNLSFDNGLLVSSVRYNQTSETTKTTLDSTVYTYNNGKKVTAALYIYNGSKFIDNTTGTYTETFEYNTNGDMTADILTSVSRYGNYVTYYEYLYSDVNTDYAPTNLTVVAKTGANVAPNLVTLNWSASTSSAVTGYRVVCDTIVSETITGTTYSTSSQGQNGTHHYAVIAVVGSELKNISNTATIVLSDPGVLPASNVHVISMSDKKESDGSYDVTIAWDAPQTNSTLTKYRVYYSTYSYVEVTESPAVINIPSYVAEGTDWNTGDTYGLNVNLYVVAMYSTGMAEKSNTVVCNPFEKTVASLKDIYGNATSVYHNSTDKTLNFSENVTATVFNINGTEVKKLTNGSILSVSDVTTGVYVVKMINKNGAISISKCVIR